MFEAGMEDAELAMAVQRTVGTRLSVRDLGPRTWSDFVQVVEKRNGVWGGCWCETFHRRRGEPRHITTSDLARVDDHDTRTR